MKSTLWIFFTLCCTALGLTWLVNSADARPLQQESLHKPLIYAYRDWQSLGILVKAGDRVEISASGQWYYTPRQYHGPAGHPDHLAPDFYPVTGVQGGVLIGRIGEAGQPFYVGEHTVIANYSSDYYNSASSESVARAVPESGLLYLRINDDILGDNAGAVAVEIVVTEQMTR